MHTKGAHIIQKLVVEVNTSTTKQGYGIKDNARSFIDQYVIPAVESYLAEMELFVGNDQVVQIDQLAIEIATDSIELNSPELTFIIQQAFEKKLSGSSVELAQLNYLQQQQNNTTTKVNQLKQQQLELDEVSEKESVQWITGTAHQVNAFFYFLEFGTRPWWSKDAIAFNQYLEEEKVLDYIEKELQLFSRLFLKKIVNNRTKRRFVLQFSDIVLAEIALLIANPQAKSDQREINQFYTIVEDLKWYHALNATSRLQFWEFILEYVLQFLAGKTISDEACGVQLQQILVKELSRTLEYNDRTLLLRNQVRVIRWLHRLANISKSASYYDSLIASFIKMSVSISKDQLQVNAGSNTSASIVTSESTLKSIEQKQLEKDQQSAVDKEELFEEEKRVTLNEKLQDKVEDELVQQFEKLELLGLSTDDEVLLVEISDGLLVDNAGLILLHPFLKHFFKKVALLEDDEKSFTDPFLAVHLLHFIATGIEQDFEHTLLFEKYLVGLPFEEIVPKNVVISDELKLEVVSLLEAVKENWEPLRTTSNEGLRETFLVRSGKLMNLNEHPRVVIERKTVDILLEKIDWSMSLVHFPWMEKLLYVEW